MTETQAEAPAPRLGMAPPCRAKVNRRGGVCGMMATHDVLLHCPTCAYNEVRSLCAPHARRARRRWWWCRLCGASIIHAIVER